MSLEFRLQRFLFYFVRIELSCVGYLMRILCFAVVFFLYLVVMPNSKYSCGSGGQMHVGVMWHSVRMSSSFTKSLLLLGSPGK